MKQKLLKTMLLLFALVAGTNMSWADTKVLTFDVSSNPGGWPTTNSTTLTSYTYTLSGVDYTFGLNNVKCNSGYLMMTSPAVLGLPAIAGYKLTKVVASNSSSCSTSTKVGISSSSSSAFYITGGAAQTWLSTSSSYTYNLTSTEANTVYYLYVTSKNAQVTSLELTYEEVVSGLTANDLTLNASEKEFDLIDGDSQTFQLTNSGSADGALSYESSNTDVATVSNTGLITAIAEGSATITVTQAASSTYEGGTADCVVTVTDSRYNKSSLVFESSCGGSGTADDGASWTVTSDGTESTYDATCGIHYGTGSANVTYLQLATSDINGQIAKVVVNARDAQATATISVTVGGTSFTCTGSTTATNTSTDYTFTGTGSGEIVVRVDRGSSMTKALYVKSVKVSYVPSTDPSISASDVNIAYDATNGTIAYTINNEVTGGVLTAAITDGNDGDWLTLGSVTTNVPLTCSANNANSSRTATVTLTYTYNTSETVTKDVIVTQAGNPNITTISALFAAATGTSTPVSVTFGDWVVTGVNGKQAFVTDGTNGFIVYQNEHGFVAGNILSGTASCNLVLYNGSAEITGLTSTTTGLTVTTGGSVSPVVTTIDALVAVNTGSVVTLNNLTYDGTNLSDGTNTVTPYSTLYEASYTSGKKYNVTGVFVMNNTTKRICPRSAADVEEVPEPRVAPESLTIEATAAETSDVLNVTYEYITTVAADVEYYEADGTTPTTYSWFTASINSTTNNLEYLIEENTSSESRTAYLKVWAYDDEMNEVYSELVTVTQAGVVVDYATLPFIWAGGTSSEFTAVTGATANNIGDYAVGNAPYRIKMDGTGDYIQIKTDDQPGVVFVDVKMIGGGNDSSFTVEESANGSTFYEVETLSISGSQNDVLHLSTVSSFASTTRYVRLTFTKGSNVGVGAITVTKPVKFNSEGYATFASTNGLDFSGAAYTAWIVTAISGETITFKQVNEAPANTGLLLMGTAGETATLTKKADATLSETNLLVGVTTPTPVTAGQYYGLKGNQFVPVAASTVPAGKAILTAPAGVKEFLTFSFEDDADGIEKAFSDSPLKGENIYNLAGQRLSKMQKGINIVNGKKILY